MRGFYILEFILSILDMVAPKGLPPWIEGLIDKIIQMLQNDMLKSKIQLLILQPFLQYIIELLFPYVIIICVIIGLMIVMMISIISLLLFQMRNELSVIAGGT